MRWLKKILRIIAIILPVICCAFISVGDSHAKQYSIDSYLAYPLYGVHGQAIHDNLSVYLDSTSNLSPRHFGHLQSEYINGSCSFTHYYSSPIISQYQIIWGHHYYPNEYNVLSQLSTSALCDTLAPYGGNYQDLDIPHFSWSNVPLNQNFNVSSLMPYNVMFTTIPMRGVFNDKDGKNIFNDFNIADDLFPTDSKNDSNFYSHITGFDIPINFTGFESLSADTSLIVSGRISDIYTNEFYSNGAIQVLFRSPSFSHYYDCEVGSLNSTQDSFDLVADSRDFYCRIPISTDLAPYTYGLTFHFGYPTGTTRYPIFRSTPNNFIKSILITTNNNYDYYSGDLSSYPNTGSYPNVAPSMPDPDTDTDSWFQKLISMFNFNILNPFQSIFNMFSNSDSCSHIPIIAGMLHATDDTYCPWFPSTVRQVLTPVISISATMLLFGFFISFLKSSSGNDTIDAGGHGSIFRGRLK